MEGSRTIEVNGTYLTVMPNDSGISKELKIFGNHEPLGVRLLASALREGMTCIDIGANIGFYAVLEGKIVGRGGKVIAIEPSPVSYGYLMRNLSMNKVSFEAYNIAISDVDSEVLFKVDRRYSNWSRVTSSSELSDGDVIPVQAMTLDTLLSRLRLDRVNLVRMDVEGHEARIARGWNETIRRFKPILFVEVHRDIGKSRIMDFLRFLVQEGYGKSSYIERRINEPLLARNEDIRETTVSELLERFGAGQVLPTYFHLFAWPEHALTGQAPDSP